MSAGASAPSQLVEHYATSKHNAEWKVTIMLTFL